LRDESDGAKSSRVDSDRRSSNAACVREGREERENVPSKPLLLAALVVLGLVTGSSALAEKPGNSLNAKLCQKNGWMSLYTRSGEAFKTESACISYTAQGGQLIVRAALDCLDDGWQALGSSPTEPFASEQACVDFANGGGTAVALGADLTLSKSVEPSVASVGDTVTFTVTLTNAGPGAATGVTVRDLLPAGLTFVSATPSQGTYVSATGLWTVGTVTTGTPQALAIRGTLTAVTPQTNTATVTHSDQFDPDTANNTASTQLGVRSADLAIAKSASNTSPTVGDTVTFTVTLTNSGPDVATGVGVSDVMSGGLTFLSATPSQGSFDAATGLWTVGTVTSSTPQTLQVVARVVSTGPQSNTATITQSAQADPDATDNTAAANLVAQPPSADLALAKSVAPTAASVGDTVTFTVTLTNSGPSVATGVEVSDLLPDGLAFVSATPSQGTYTPATGLWTVGTVMTGAPPTMELVVRVVSPGPHTNTATVSRSDQPDPDTTNNTASAELGVASADLALAKSVDPIAANLGEVVTFTVTLTNNGPTAATGVEVSDLLPDGLAFVSATPSQGTYTPATGLWTVGTVTTSDPQTLEIKVALVLTTPQTNTATVTHSDQPDPDGANNSASSVVRLALADLAVAKSASNTTPNVGDTITFTVTLTNNGPDAATGVAVSDVLSAGLSFVSATPSQGAFNSVIGLWSVGAVAAGTSQTLQIEATVVSAGQQANTAMIAHSDQFDPDAGNNTASVALN
jgi:uncharacterized repeat protein (TIGR01451 family)